MMSTALNILYMKHVTAPSQKVLWFQVIIKSKLMVKLMFEADKILLEHKHNGFFNST